MRGKSAIFVVATACFMATACAPEVGAPTPAANSNTVTTPTTSPTDDLKTTLDEVQSKVFTPTCAVSNCHGNPRLAPMSLMAGDTYGALVSAPSAQVPNLDRVLPGAPEDSYLVLKIEGRAGTVGGNNSRMPKGRPTLSDEDIQLIRNWIRDEALP